MTTLREISDKMDEAADVIRTLDAKVKKQDKDIDELRNAIKKVLMYREEYFPEMIAPSFSKQVRWLKAIDELKKALKE